MTRTRPLDLDADVVSLARALCDIPSVSGEERAIADAVEQALTRLPHLKVSRDGDAVVARTELGRPDRVVIAGHLDTVPIADNLPTWLDGEGSGLTLHGRGSVDMKAGVAVQLRVAAGIPEPRHDLTFVFYDQEEVEASRSGLGRLARGHPDWLVGDFAILCEPTAATVEGGCQGTMRVDVAVPGVAAHSARSGRGTNAIHAAVAVLRTLNDYRAREVDVDGLLYREGLSAVGIRGGIAGNVIPDLCVVSVNYRFAPDRDVAGAEAHLRELFSGFDVTVTDAAPGARPGLHHPAAAEFVAAVGRPPAAKFGWTDVSRFSALDVPAVNYGPGDPNLAHTDGEHCPVDQIMECERVLRAWLAPDPSPSP
jgi:succinyl-diaminopimelate desuccinylase